MRDIETISAARYNDRSPDSSLERNQGYNATDSHPFVLITILAFAEVPHGPSKPSHSAELSLDHNFCFGCRFIVIKSYSIANTHEE